ncbi:CDP-glycerol glycerophosphotransferase family protein [Xanthomonas sp. AmX2]|uniref:CDP-glycerol glycerophosphotransferase family protein n=1 Tax=Xanthomonas sp. TaxID=29446 RepID=UPI00197FF4F4|nr:CDP-glycerol glycerophosphotransferase family protein [Xanthomonas sp.]MBN6150087.1 CDP-glycerol glycerophosphotransferase family protein [Xanthomonas sp.]
MTQRQASAAMPASCDAPWWRRGIGSVRLGRAVLALWWCLDRLLPKRDDHWAFFAHPLKPTQFVENARAVFEQVGADPGIYKLVFVRGAAPPLRLDAACNTRVLELGSIAGLLALARCGVLLLTNSVAMDLSLHWRDGSYDAPRASLRRRVVVNLWHGIPLKRLFALANPEQRRHGDRNAARRRERRHYAGLVASSDVDSYAMAAIFHPLPPDRVWVTGLPRNDFLRMPEDALPATLREQTERLRQLRRGRPLVLYAPTYRDTSVAATPSHAFSDGEVARLRELLQAAGAVLGVRGHYLRNAAPPFDPQRHLDDDVLLDLEHERFPEIAPLLREAAVVLTDYSSVYIDAMYLDLPVLSFAWDLEHYRTRQNGLLYDMALAFPGPVATDFDTLLEALDAALKQRGQAPDARYRAAQRMFFNHRDAHNSQRLVQRLRAAIAQRAHR